MRPAWTCVLSAALHRMKPGRWSGARVALELTQDGGRAVFDGGLVLLEEPPLFDSYCSAISGRCRPFSWRGTSVRDGGATEVTISGSIPVSFGHGRPPGSGGPSAATITVSTDAGVLVASDLYYGPACAACHALP